MPKAKDGKYFLSPREAAQHDSQTAQKPAVAPPVEAAGPAVDPMAEEVNEPVTCPKCGTEFVPDESPLEQEQDSSAPAPDKAGYMSKMMESK